MCQNLHFLRTVSLIRVCKVWSFLWLYFLPFYNDLMSFLQTNEEGAEIEESAEVAVEHEDGGGGENESPGDATVLEEAPSLQEASEA